MSNLKPEAFYRRNLPHFVPPGACALPHGQAHPLATRAAVVWAGSSAERWNLKSEGPGRRPNVIG